MTEKEKMEEMACAIIILSRRLLRLENSEKYRKYLRDIITSMSKNILEIERRDEQ